MERVPGGFVRLPRDVPHTLSRQYVEWLEARAASISDAGPSTDGLVPGNRHIPMR